MNVSSLPWDHGVRSDVAKFKNILKISPVFMDHVVSFMTRTTIERARSLYDVTWARMH